MLGFVRIPSTEWRLQQEVERARIQRLSHGPDFYEIVRSVRAFRCIARYKRTKLKDLAGFYRIELCLEMDADVVDLFHNGSAGYRAQYYASPELGDRANEYLLQELVPRICETVTSARRRTCPAEWVEKSLRAAGAKLWVHQGLWLRHLARSDRGLHIDRWLRYQWDSRQRHKRYWSQLTPSTETKIVVKGTPLTLDGGVAARALKPHRSRDIHVRGYT